MAEAQPTDSGDDRKAEECTSDLNASVLECAVCLQPCVHPALLPCGHIFCFLCLKGVANQSKKCAMCRQEIPSDYLDKPRLVEQSASVKETPALEDGYQWFYEGRNGWWQYDERTCRELEASYKHGDRTCDLLIAGFLYVADFDAMLQLRRTELTRRRRIKRDLATIPKKGVAGLRQVGGASSKCPNATGDGITTGDGNTTQGAGGGVAETTTDAMSSVVEQIRSLGLGATGDSSEEEEEGRGGGEVKGAATLVVTSDVEEL